MADRLTAIVGLYEQQGTATTLYCEGNGLWRTAVNIAIDRVLHDDGLVIPFVFYTAMANK